MAANITLPTVLANLAAGNQALSLIDGDLTTLRDPLLALNTFSNYYTDVGAANAYAITVSSPQTVSQTAGLRVQFLAAHANTGASTFQINAFAVKNILNLDGTALSANQIPANSIADVIYDGTQYLLLNAIPTYVASTWTPSVGGSATYTTQLGRHTRIGRQVFLECSLVINVLGTGSASTITGLPFAANASTLATGAVFWANAAASFVAVTASIASGASQVILLGAGAAAASLTTAGVLGDGATVQFSMSYTV